jgi:hypothetical protein
MGKTWQGGGYSAEVRAHLECKGRLYEVAEIGPDTMLLRNHDDLPSGHARLVVEIDGDREVRDIIVSCHNADLAEIGFA